jgi:hypothetical protein
MAHVDVTYAEAATLLDPPVTCAQIATLTFLAGIRRTGYRHTGKPGHPPSTFDLAEIQDAHAREAARTAKQFTDNDWIAFALLGRSMLLADTDAGELRWPDGTRAERANARFYGTVRAGPERVAAHRVIWIAADGEIPPGIQVNHINNLHWDNRRANLELVTFGNNIRHAYGKDYLTYHEAVRQLAVLPPPLSDAETLAGSTVLSGARRAGGAFRR